MGETTREAVEQLRDACDDWLADETEASAQAVITAMGTVMQDEVFGGDGSAGPNAPDSGGGLPPFHQ